MNGCTTKTLTHTQRTHKHGRHILQPLDMDTIRASLSRTHKLAILDESTSSGGVGATISALVNVRSVHACLPACPFAGWDTQGKGRRDGPTKRDREKERDT